MSLNIEFHGNLPTNPSYRGLCMSPEGLVLAVPYSGNTGRGVLKITPNSSPMQIENIDVANLKTTAGEGWIAAGLAPNGKILMSTWNQQALLVVDTTTSNWDISAIATGNWQQRGMCVGIDGDWWTSPWVSSFVRKVNSNTHTVTNYSVSYQQHTHPNNQVISDPAWNRPAGFGWYNRYWGCVAGPDRLMFGIPWTAERVLVINPDGANTPQDPVAYEAGGVNGLVTGNNWNETFQNQWYSPSNTLLNVLGINSPAQKYTGGTMCPISKKIVCMPRRSPAVLVIDPMKAPAFGEDAPEGFIREIPLPKDNVFFNYNGEGGGLSNYFGSAPLADGRIISVPWNNHNVVIWDGRTETVEFVTIDEISPANATGNMNTGVNMFTSGLLLEDGRTIFSPFGPTKLMTVDVGANKTLTRDNLLQRWINRSL